MTTQKLSTVDAFVVRDFPNAPSFGVVRAANKILPAGAGEMARSMTYRFGLLEMKRGGASAGINAPADHRPAAVAAFAAEILPEVQAGTLMLDRTAAVDPEAYVPVISADPRNPIGHQTVNHANFDDRLVALGSLAAATTAAGGLDGKRVAIEGFGDHGPTLASGVVANGGQVVGISAGKGAVIRAGGFTPEELAQSWSEHGQAMVEQLGDDVLPANRIFGADADVLFVGSKMGAVNHVGAEFVTAKVVAATTPVPYTTKAVLMLERAGTTVLPDFLTTAGPSFAHWAPAEQSAAEIESEMIAGVAELTASLLTEDDIPVIAGAKRAEAFMATWQKSLPFGRPFAP